MSALFLITNVFSQTIEIKVKQVEYYSYHEQFPELLNVRETRSDLNSKYIFDCDKKIMKTEFKNYPENNSMIPIHVNYSKGGIYTFSFSDTDMETNKLQCKTLITVDTNKEEVLYTIYTVERRVFKNFKFTDFEINIYD